MKKFAFVTDLHLDEPFPISQGANARQNFAVVLNDIRRRGISEVVLGGDLGENDSNQWLFDQLHDLEVSLVLGNHDELTSVGQYYRQHQNEPGKELYFVMEGAELKRVYLDSSSGTISNRQLEWFREHMIGQKPLMLFIHHCIFPVPSAIDEKHSLSNRDQLQELLRGSNLPTTIFCGHYHMDDVQTIGEIRQVITPAVSYQVVKPARPIATHADSFGYRVVTINEAQITEELVTF